MFRSKEERKAEKERMAKERAAESARVLQEKRAKKRRENEEKRRRAWGATDHGRAQVSYDAGEMFFQIQRVISVTKSGVFIMMGASSTSEEVDKSAQGGAGFMGSIVDAGCCLYREPPDLTDTCRC